MAKSKTPETEEAVEPSFEESLGQLERIVHDLEDGSLGLEDSLGEFEKAVGLLRNCYAVLEHAEQRIDVLTGFDADGNPVVTPFDGTATATAEAGGKAGRRKKPKSTPTPDEDATDDEDVASTLF